jgi:hypothetical protein
VRPVPRSRAQRKADTRALLRTEVDCWVASADELGNAHLVPLSHYWDGAALVPASRASASVRRSTSCSSTAVCDELADQLREAAEVALENLWTPEGLRSAMNAFGITVAFKPGLTGRRLRISGRAVT